MKINKVFLGGNLTHDPDLSETKTGKPICRFSIATNKPTGEALFFNCIAWENNAKNIAKYFSKGDPILIEGEIDITKDEKATYINVNTNRFYFVGQKQKGNNEDNK